MEATQEKPPLGIAIVGAGTVGIVAALLAIKKGIGVSLFDRVPPGKKGGRVFTINRPAREVLMEIGAWEKLGTAMSVRRMKVFSPKGSLLDIKAKSACTAQLCHTVQEGELSKVLGSLLEEKGARVNIVSDVTSMANESEHAIFVMGGRAHKAQLVIGTDGQSSKVAFLAGLEGKRHNFRQSAITAMARFPKVGRTAWQWMGADGVLALLPTSEKSCGIVWSLDQNKARECLSHPEKKLKEELVEKTCGKVGECVSIDSISSHPLGCQVRKTTGNRVLLLGDSAHSMHPLAGQNLSVALGGMPDLFDTLDPKDPGLANGLESYARLRRIRVATTAWLTSAMAGVIGDASKAGVAMDIGFCGMAQLGSYILPHLANAR